MPNQGGRPFSAELIITSNHAATHVDAFGHYQPGGAAVADMPLDTFCGEAVCVDIRQYGRGHDVSAAEVEQAVAELLGPPTARGRDPAVLLRPLQQDGGDARLP